MATQGWRSMWRPIRRVLEHLLGRQFLRLSRELGAYRWAYRGQGAGSPRVDILWVINLEQAGAAGVERDEAGELGCGRMASVLLGAVPATGFLRQSGIGLDSRGFIPVNKVGLDEVGRVGLGHGWTTTSAPLDHPQSPPLPTDDADQHPRSVCCRGCCHLSSCLEEQSESEHPTLADGSCPGYGPRRATGWATCRATPQLLIWGLKFKGWRFSEPYPVFSGVQSGLSPETLCVLSWTKPSRAPLSLYCPLFFLIFKNF